MDRLERTRNDPAARRAAAPSRRFSDALRSVPGGAEARAAGRSGAARAAGRATEDGPGAGGEAEGSADPGPGAGPRMPGFAEARLGRRARAGEEGAGAEPEAARPTVASQDLAGPRPAPAVSGEAGLRAAVRALPVAVEVFHARGGEALSLDLGRAISVELRAAPAGVELVLRPDATLSHVAAAELPALVGALRERGIPVATAAVQARPGRGRG